jgi:hypothetical protein
MKANTALLTKQMGRRGFMRVLTSAGISAAATTQLGRVALAQSNGIDDLAILQLATTAEYLAVDAYTKILGAGFEGDTVEYLAAAREQEQAHLDALIDTITLGFSEIPVAKPDFVYPVEFTKDNQMKILEVMIALETAFTGAYLGAIPLIQNKDVLAAAASIAMNEEAHLTILRDTLIGMGGMVEGPQVPNGRTFGVAITPEEATAAVTSFIKPM